MLSLVTLCGRLCVQCCSCKHSSPAPNDKPIFVLNRLFCRCIAYLVFLHGVASPAQVAYLSQPPVGPFGAYAPMAGVIIANTAFGALAYWPLFLMPTAEAKRE